MHDLATIAARNAKAVEGSIAHYRALGRWVVATYTGLHIDGFETFSDEKVARNVAAAVPPSPDVRYQLFEPIPADQVVGKRDQSEDRVPG